MILKIVSKYYKLPATSNLRCIFFLKRHLIHYEELLSKTFDMK